MQAIAEPILQSPAVLTGDHFDLAIEPHRVNFTGRRMKAIKINGSLPGPTLKWRERRDGHDCGDKSPSGSGGNIAVLTGKDGKLLIDSGFAVSKPRIVRELDNLS